jgi:hypothetical protein
MTAGVFHISNLTPGSAYSYAAVVFASQLGQVALDAHMAMLNVAGLTFMTGPMAGLCAS